MDGWTILIVIAGIVVLGLHIGISISIANAAHAKGHGGAGFFWLCLLFPPFGHLLVAALPDYTTQNMIKQLQADIHIIKDELLKEQTPVSIPEKHDDEYDDSLPTL